MRTRTRAARMAKKTDKTYTLEEYERMLEAVECDNDVLSHMVAELTAENLELTNEITRLRDGRAT